MEGDIFFVYHNVTQWPNIYDFFLKPIWSCRKEAQIINIGSHGKNKIDIDWKKKPEARTYEINPNFLRSYHRNLFFEAA